MTSGGGRLCGRPRIVDVNVDRMWLIYSAYMYNYIYIYKTVVSVVCSHLSAVSRRCTPRSIDARATVRAYVNVRNESGRGAETAYAVTYCSAQVEEMFAVSFFKLREQFTFRVTKGRSDAGEHQSGETPTTYAYGCPAEQWQQEPGGSSLSMGRMHNGGP